MGIVALLRAALWLWNVAGVVKPRDAANFIGFGVMSQASPSTAD